MKRLAIQRSWCKGCNICVAFCPKQVLALDDEDKVYAKNPDACIYCKLCEIRCPDLAIEVKEEPDDAAGPAPCSVTGAETDASAKA